MVAFVIVLTLVMLLAGVFGGLINYFLLNQSNRDTTKMARCVVVGVGAAFLVPVVLDLVGSEMVTQSQDDAGKLLIYIGLCLIAAIASRVVVTNDVDRTLQASEAAKQDAEAIAADVRQLRELLLPMVETETEMAALSEEDQVLVDGLDVASTQTLKVLGTGRHIFRTQESLLSDVEMDEQSLHKSLQVLMQKGLAGKVTTEWGLRWFLNERGRRMAENVI